MGKSAKPATSTSNASSSTATTQTVSPWTPADPLYQTLLQGAGTAYAATPKTVDPNAAASATQVAGWAGSGAQPAYNLALSSLNGDFLDPTKNAPLQAAIAAGIDPLRKQLSQNVTSIGDAAQQAGAYGGSRQGVVEGTALGDFNHSAMDLGANLNYQDYQQERQNQLNSPAMMAQAVQLGLAPSSILNNVQAQSVDAPWAGLDRLMQVLQSTQAYGTQTGTSTGNSTSVGTQAAAQASGASGALSGAVGGASAGAAFGPWGAGIGAVLGGLGGLFG